MKPISLLTQAQQDAITHIYETGETYLIGQMGSGKSVVALTAAAELLAAGVVTRVLIFAPKKVANDVWRHEHKTWEHLKHLTVGIATGTAQERLNVIIGPADIVVINYENVEWFYKSIGAIPCFGMLIVDEVTKLKAGKGAFKALRKHLKDFSVRVVMTGTPVAEAWTDLFYCMFACDNGRHFGKNKASFLLEYFYPTDYEQRNWAIRGPCVDTLTTLISDTVIVLPDYTDELPELDEQHILITLPEEAMEYYQQFERDSLNDDTFADSAAVQVGKLQQIASGFVYSTDAEGARTGTADIHRAKMAQLKNRYKHATIFVYQFEEELRRLKVRYPDGRALGKSDKEDAITLAMWRDGSLHWMFLHPKSAGHGLDLTAGHEMVIMSPIWSRDQMRQTIARIWRRNQKHKCTVRVLIAKGTIDESIVAREEGKGGHHDLLMERLQDAG